MTYAQKHIAETVEIASKIDVNAIETMADLLAGVKSEDGRIFFLGVGGSAGNCGHAVNDFRKIVGIEAYAPTDNVSELTARTNDEGWATIFAEWLKVSKLKPKDALFIFSVGGGNLEKNISPNLVEAIKYAKSVGAKVTGVVGRDGGYTAQAADACCIIPTVNSETVTPHSEAFQAVVWHLLVSHPKLKANQTKWESTARKVKRAVFLDRDGVLNRAIVRDGKPYPPAHVSELEILPGSKRLWRGCARRAFCLIVVTNQPDVARGATTREAVEDDQRRPWRGVADRRIPNLLSTTAERMRMSQAQARRIVGRGGASRYRSRTELHGRGPLARYRSWPARRLQDYSH